MDADPLPGAVGDADVLLDADALADGRAFVVLDGFVRIPVGGADAVAWLHDLLTADVSSLPMGGAVRSFVLTPTGRIRVEARAVRRADGVDLIERVDEPRSIATTLAPYVLTSDVELGEPEPVSLVALPGADDLVSVAAARAVPSILGDGRDLVVPPHEVAAVRAALAAAGHREAGTGAAEIVRIRRGIPRWGVDVVPETFPVGARVDEAVAFAKGCYLGQEAIARIRNLGHPPTVVRHLTVAAEIRRGAAVRGPEGSGEVTSAAPTPDRRATVVLARVDHRAASAPLALEDGTPLRDVDAAPPI